MTNIRFRLGLDAGTLRLLLDYDSATGKFYKANGPSRGKEVGSVTARGYVTVGVAGKSFLAHRLAWLHVHGEWPPVYIDHINGVTTDNRIINLRAVTPLENSQNSKVMRARLNKIQALRSLA